MSVTAAVVRELVAAGLSGEALIAALERIEAAAVPVRTARQERNARYYQAHKEQIMVKASERRLNASEASENVLSLDDKDPHTPKNTNPSPKENPPKGGQKKGTPLPADWQPSELDRAYCRKLGLTDREIDQAAERMRLWAAANANRDVARKSDWSAAFKNWVQNDRSRAPPVARLVVKEGFV